MFSQAGYMIGDVAVALDGPLKVHIRQIMPGEFRASCPSLIGCVVYGPSVAHVKQSIRTAVTRYLASLDAYVMGNVDNLIDYD